MDEFPGLLSRDFGFHPQGKSAPMAASKGSSTTLSSSATPLPSLSSLVSSNARSNRESTLLGDPSPTDQYGGRLEDLDGIFGGSSRSVNQQMSSTTSSSFNYDSVFDGFKDHLAPSASSPPIYDKPVYDDDLFDGIPGLRTSSTGKFDDVFASLSSSPHHKHGVEGDLLGDLSGKDRGSSGLGRNHSKDASEHAMPCFDDLIPGFGRNSPPHRREYEANHQRSSSQPTQSTTNLSSDNFLDVESTSIPSYPSSRLFIDPHDNANIPSGYTKFDTSSQPKQSSTHLSSDPFLDLESTSVPSYPSSKLFQDPHDDVSIPSGNTKFDISDGLFDDLNAFNGFNKSTPPFSSDINDNQKEGNPLKTSQKMNPGVPLFAKESEEKSSVKNSTNTINNKGSGGSYEEPEHTQNELPFDNVKSAGKIGAQTANSNLGHFEENRTEHLREVDDIWITVSEIPLFTQPTSAPPPSRPPPSFALNADSSIKRKDSANFSFPQHTPNSMFSESFTDSPKEYGVSSLDELEEFAMGKPQAYADDQAEVISSEEDSETTSAAAAAMKRAMDTAELKIRQARELREKEKESRVGKNRDFIHQGQKDEVTSDFHSHELDGSVGTLDVEREQQERVEKEKERRRLEKERQKELEKKREKAAVEMALREARERAAADARQKAERAAVEKANAEARERAARAAVQRAASEARERAAAEARAAAEERERAATAAKEKAAREAREKEEWEREARERDAREKAAAITRERERAAVRRAAADARARAERAAVQRANAEARERAAAAARARQNKNENDLDSIFGTGSRASSEPKQRANTPDFSFDAQARNRGGSNGVQTASSVSSSSGVRKTSSANFLDDLNSVFAPSASGEFQEIDGESDERRRARLERHQRTLERAAKALAEKNQRDMQVQREQVERDRIAESLEIEIKRWCAGKEGNLRALLSTLQYVLWPECGWQPVSLTDLITSASVKKVYRKATLHIHPDKVQQKGANLQQKIIAEKVFDLLKEAWNKFNSEELF